MSKERNRQMIRLLALDMDGTCLNGRSRMTEETIRTIRKAADAGIIIVPTSGRPLTCLPYRMTQEKGLYRYTITSNGAQVVDLEEKKTLFRMLMKRERVVQFLRECEGLNVVRMTHIQHRYVMEGPLMEVAGRIVYGRDVDGIRRVNDMEAFVEKIHYNIEEVQVYFFSGRTRRKVAEILEGYPDFSSAFGSKYVEIFAKNTSKGTALNALASRLGIAKEEIACIGDSANDLPMFEAAGLKIAMGNAVPELKKKADIVTYSNHIDGAAKAIEQYIL